MIPDQDQTAIPTGIDIEATPVRDFRPGARVDHAYDTESLARVAASHCFSEWDSEAIEWIWTVIEEAETRQVSASYLLTGTDTPGRGDYGPPRALPDGTHTRFSTRADPTEIHREIAALCLIGSIANPCEFWRFCRRHRMPNHVQKMVGIYASVDTSGDTDREHERRKRLTMIARAFDLDPAALIRLRLWR